jgi:hypothetical protein
LIALALVEGSSATAFAQAETSGGATVSGKRRKAHPRVVLLAVTDDDPLAARLAAELEVLGLDVSRGKIDPTGEIEDHVKQALAGGARGVVVADGRRTEFWVAEEGSDRVAMRQELEIETGPSMESVLSLRTVEFLRVSLGLVGRAAPPPPPPPPPPVAAPVEADRRVMLGLVSGVVAATGRLAPYATVGAALRVRIVGPAGLEVRGLAPIGSQSIAGPNGRVDLSVWLAGGGLVFAPRLAPFGFELGAGALAVVLRGTGATDPAAVAVEGSSDNAFGVAIYGRAAARLQLSPAWTVRVDVMGGSTAPQRPNVGVVASSRETVTTWGLGFVAGLAGIEAAF